MCINVYYEYFTPETNMLLIEDNIAESKELATGRT
jgi:hypothetical protein